MNNKNDGQYKPDFTLKNAKKVIWGKKKQTIVLSCKNSPHGVSPTERWFIYVAAEFGVIFISLVFAILSVLVHQYAPKAWSEIVKTICILLLSVACYGGLLPICVLLSLRFSRWVPAWNPDEKNEQTQRTGLCVDKQKNT